MKCGSCRKPKKTSVEAHVRRIGHLTEIANAAPGTEPKIDLHHFRNILIKTFPKAWQWNWTTSGHDADSDTIQDIKNYFSEQKRLYDERDASSTYKAGGRSSFKNKSEGKGGNNKKKHKGNGNSNGPNNDKKPISDDDPCPLCQHKNTKHKWGQCFNNKNSPNFRPPRSNNSQGHQGRGNWNRANSNQGGKYDDRKNYRQNRYNNNNNNVRADSHYQQDSQQSYQQQFNQTTNNSQASYQDVPAELHAYDAIGGGNRSTNTHTSRPNTYNHSSASWNEQDGQRNKDSNGAYF